MTLAAPWMLLGLLAMIPLVLLHTRVPRIDRTPFPAMRLLMDVARAERQRTRLHDNILLLLRLAIIAGVCMAMSRPSISVWRPGGVRSGPAIGLVIVLDTSISMGVRETGQKSVFEQAKEMATKEIDRLRPTDMVTVITAGMPATPLLERLTVDKGELLSRLQRVSVGAGRIDDAAALERAVSLLGTADVDTREILYITDMVGRAGPDLSRIPQDMEVKILSLEEPPASVDNVAIKDVVVTVTGTDAVTTGDTFISAFIVNYGSTRVSGLDVVLHIEEEEVGRGKVTVPPRQTVEKRFHHRFSRRGYHVGQVRIGDDILKTDNVRHFGTEITAGINVLIISGDYRPGSHLSESFYLEKALSTSVAGQVPISSRVTDMETGGALSLDRYDGVFLLAPDRPPDALCHALEAYLAQGGGLLVAPGNKQTSFGCLEALLPREVLSDAIADGDLQIKSLERSHPVFDVFDEDMTGLENMTIERYLHVKPSTAPPVRPLITLTNGMPLLLEGTVSGGRVLLFMTSMDRDWSDAPIRPGYLPLVQRTAHYLADSLSVFQLHQVTAGEPVSITPEMQVEELVVVSPDGTRTRVPSQTASPDEETGLKYTRTQVPGVYRVWGKTKDASAMVELTTATFVVNPAVDETDISKKWDMASPTSLVQFRSYKPEKGWLPIWSYLLMSVLALLFVEGGLSCWRMRRA